MAFVLTMAVATTAVGIEMVASLGVLLLLLFGLEWLRKGVPRIDHTLTA